MTASQDLVHRMVGRFLDLQPLLEAHLEDMGGELLPYLVLADTVRWAQTEVVVDAGAVATLVDWLEREFAQAAAAEKDLIGLGFVESIPSAPDGDALLRQLGPRLRQVAEDLGLLAR